MKRTLKLGLLALVIFIGTLSINAQDKTVTFGAKAGLNVSHFNGKLSDKDLADLNSKFGYNIGATVDFAFSPSIYLLTGLELTTKGAVEYRKGKEVSINAMYINMPVHFGYKLQIDDNPVFVFRAGPYVGYGIGGKTTVKGEDTKTNTFSPETGYKKLDFGLGTAVGIEAGKIVVELGYNFGLLDISERKESVRARNYFVNVGYKF